MSRTESGGKIKRISVCLILVFVILIGGYASWLRFAEGLGATTALSDAVPWGLWIWFDLSMIALSAGGFIMCALFYIFRIHRLQPLVRPAVLTAILGYSIVGATLIYDLGLPLRFWHPLYMWNFHSVMLEVAWCIGLYLVILTVEMSIPATEGLGWARMTGLLKKFCVLLALLGAVLSILHQSSLGALFLLVPEKLDPLWYSSWLPILFLASAFVGGLGVLIIEMFLVERFIGVRFSPSLFQSLARLLLGALLLYLFLFITEFTLSGKWGLLGRDPDTSAWLGLEVISGTILPMALLLFHKLRSSRAGLLFCAVLCVTGVILNRLNVILVELLMRTGTSYFPTWQEFSITIMFIALGIALFVVVSRRFPVFET